MCVCIHMNMYASICILWMYIWFSSSVRYYFLLWGTFCNAISPPPEKIVGTKQLSVSINLCSLIFILPLFPGLNSYLFQCSLDSPLKVFLIIIKMLQTSKKNKIVRAAWGEKDTLGTEEEKIRMTADVLLETMQVRRLWSKSFKILKEKKKFHSEF